ncbi:hypothetical protein HCN44_004435 [Aphidius gifuensis]|uniref:Serine/threonine-protein kinase SAK n=1 Tax=Aphidius gifuensis TaxID=684658 RepID=A0A834XWT3_APHGI|nr:hypothetical protein HCN44_004435 [Aphidius gifuensis]
MVPGMIPHYENRGFCSNIEAYRPERTPFDTGAFASVHRGTCPLTEKTVAIKMLLREKIIQSQTQLRVQSEIEIHSKLKHKSIVELYTVYEDENYVYLVMEYCPGGNGMPESLAITYLHQIIEGLIYLHSQKIIHRDFSPSNVLLTKDNKCKIADFGLSTSNCPDATNKTMCGTPNFIAPEIARNSTNSPKCSYGPPVDVWSLGVLMYVMLVGKAPFHSSSIPETLNKIQDGQFKIPSHVSRQSQDLILKLMKIKPEERISLRDALNHPLFGSFDKESYYGNNNIHSSRTMSADGDSGLGNTLSSSSATTMSQRLSSPREHQQIMTNNSSIAPIITTNISNYNYRHPNSSSNNNNNNNTKLSDIFHSNNSNINNNNQPWNNNIYLTSTPRPPDTTEKTLLTPINSERLAPTRHKTRNAILTILKNGEICIELLKKHRDQTEKIHEVFRISSDGRTVQLYKPAYGKIGDEPPSPTQCLHCEKWSIDLLPQKHLKKYYYADKFIKLVKAKTPKLTIYHINAKVLYMENGPNPDVEIHYYDGVKITWIDSCIKIIKNGVPINDNLSGELNKYRNEFHVFRKQCIDLERTLIDLENATKQSYFPAIIGRRPPPPQSILTESSSYRNKSNISSFSNNSQPIIPSYSGSFASMSSANTARSVMGGSVNSTNYPITIKARDIPGVGRISYNPNNSGNIVLEFHDGIKITISPEKDGGRTFIEDKKTNKCFSLSREKQLPGDFPDAMKEKMIKLPSLLERYGPSASYSYR